VSAAHERTQTRLIKLGRLAVGIMGEVLWCNGVWMGRQKRKMIGKLQQRDWLAEMLTQLNLLGQPPPGQWKASLIRYSYYSGQKIIMSCFYLDLFVAL